jgi:hypothetical protein
MVLKLYPARRQYIPKNIKHEQNLQSQVCAYLKLQYPHVIFRSDYASGLHLSAYQATVHRSLQSGRAWPDLQIIHPSRGYHGLFIELKKDGTILYLKTGPRKGMLTLNPHIQEQAVMLQGLNDLGYFARFGVGFDKCKRIIDWYLNPNYKEPEPETLF